MTARRRRGSSVRISSGTTLGEVMAKLPNARIAGTPATTERSGSANRFLERTGGLNPSRKKLPPGRETFPVSARMSLIRYEFNVENQVCSTDRSYMIEAASAPAISRAAPRISSSRKPQRPAISPTSTAASAACRRSKPTVLCAMKARSTRSSSINVLAIANSRKTSVAGFRRRWMSAPAVVSVTRGSTAMSLRFLARRNSLKVILGLGPRFETRGLVPIVTSRGAFSSSG